MLFPGREGRGGGGARAQDPDHADLEEREVSGEGVPGPHQGRQGQGAEGEGPREDAHQDPQDHHQEDSLRWVGNDYCILNLMMIENQSQSHDS